MRRIILAVLSVASVLVAGCDKKSDANKGVQEQAPAPKSETASEKAVAPTSVAERYKDALTRFLKIRKSRENLSYSVASKVGEEMVAFQSLSTSDQERKLKALEKQLEDYE